MNPRPLVDHCFGTFGLHRHCRCRLTLKMGSREAVWSRARRFAEGFRQQNQASGLP